MEYGKVYLTEEGKKIVAKTLQSKIFKFSHFAVGNGEIENIEELTHMINSLWAFHITKVSIENDTQVTVKGVFSNISVVEGFYLKELGLYAKDPDTSEIVLFAYVNFGNKSEFIADKNTERKEIYYDLLISVGNSNCVEIKINSETIYATEKDLEDVKKEITEEIKKKVEVIEQGKNNNGSYIKYSDGTMKCWKILDVKAGGTKWTDTLYYSDHNMGKWAQEFRTIITSKATVFSKQYWCTQEEQTHESAGTVRCFRPNASKQDVRLMIEAWGYYTEDGGDLDGLEYTLIGGCTPRRRNFYIERRTNENISIKK